MVIVNHGKLEADGGDYVVIIDYGGETGIRQFETAEEAIEVIGRNDFGGQCSLLKIVRFEIFEYVE